MKRVLWILLGIILTGLLIYKTPSWFTQFNTPHSPPQSAAQPHEAQVDAFLDETLPQVGAKTLLTRDERNGIVRSTWQLSYGISAENLTLELQKLAAEIGIDVHPLSLEGPDRVLQVFGRRDLAHEILLISAPPKLGSPDFNPNPKQRPMVALVLTGLGTRNADYIVELPVPITFAVRPYEPFSLLIAEESVHHWHEVVVDMSEYSQSSGSPIDAFNALPFASGIHIDEAIDADFPDIPLGVLLFPSHIRLPETSGSLHPLLVQNAGRLGLETAQTRALYSAQTSGVGVLSVPHNHPQIDQVIQWALNAKDEGYRLVLVSEAARERQFRGPASETEDG